MKRTTLKAARRKRTHTLRRSKPKIEIDLSAETRKAKDQVAAADAITYADADAFCSLSRAGVFIARVIIRKAEKGCTANKLLAGQIGKGLIFLLI